MCNVHMGRNKTIPRRFTAPVASSLLAQAPVSPLHNAQRSADGEMVPNGSPGRQPGYRDWNEVPSGNGWHSYWKWLFIVSFPIKHGDFP